MNHHTPEEMMAISAARSLRNDDVCFVGLGLPSVACNLARILHAPGITLVYESGTIGARPPYLPLSIADGILCETALTTVSVPEIFSYWLQGGRMTRGFLGGAQVDRFGNLNTTVIGPDYHRPHVRLPGAGGAPEIAMHCQETYIVMKHRLRSFVKRLDFVTTFGHGEGGDHRLRLGIETAGPTLLITDLCTMKPAVGTREFEVVSLHEGVSRQSVRDQTGWPVKFSEEVADTPPPTGRELAAIRQLRAATVAAHGGASWLGV